MMSGYFDNAVPLEHTHERLQAIVTSAMDAIITIDDQHRIICFNPAAERMFRISAAEALGSPIEHFIPHRFRDKHDEHIQHFGDTGETSRRMGALGAVSALAGLMAMPLAIVLALAALIDRLGPQDLLRHAFAGVTAAAAGLVVAMAVKTAQPLRRRLGAWAVCAAAFGCVAVLHLPLLPVLAVLGPLGILIAWRR